MDIITKADISAMKSLALIIVPMIVAIWCVIHFGSPELLEIAAPITPVEILAPAQDI